MADTSEVAWAAAARVGLVTGAAVGVLFGATGLVPIVIGIPFGAALGLMVGAVAGMRWHHPRHG